MKTAQVPNFDNTGTVTVRVGDYVSFKCDVEQGGRIMDIEYGSNGYKLVLGSVNGFHGGYIGGQHRTTQMARDCWVD